MCDLRTSAIMHGRSHEATENINASQKKTTRVDQCRRLSALPLQHLPRKQEDEITITTPGKA